MKMILLLIVSLQALASFSQNKNTDWIFAGTDAGGNKRFIKCDPDYKNGSVIKIWYKDSNEALDSLSGQIIPVFFVEVNCLSKTIRLLKSSVVNSKGNIIFEQSNNEPAEKIIKGSMKEVTVQKVCELYRK